MSADDRNENVDQYLHDAERALCGSRFAKSIGHFTPAAELREKHDRLLGMAQELDPGHEAPAWQEHARWLKETGNP